MENKKLAATIAAVTAYMDEEARARVPVAPPRVMLRFNSWGASGREEIMRMRTLWQRRIVSR